MNVKLLFKQKHVLQLNASFFLYDNIFFVLYDNLNNERASKTKVTRRINKQRKSKYMIFFIYIYENI